MSKITALSALSQDIIRECYADYLARIISLAMPDKEWPDHEPLKFGSKDWEECAGEISYDDGKTMTDTYEYYFTDKSNDEKRDPELHLAFQEIMWEMCDIAAKWHKKSKINIAELHENNEEIRKTSDAILDKILKDADSRL